MFGTIPGNPLAAVRPDKVAETEKVQREDRQAKSGGQRGKSPRKRSHADPVDEDPAPAKPDEVGKRIDFEA